MATGPTGPHNPIRIDPFFEGEGPAEEPPQGGLIQPNIGTAAQRPAVVDGIAPGPVQQQPGYTDAGDSRVGDGRTMAQVMRQGPEGLRGTVIPRATPGGIPAGTAPHATAGLEVNVDPHLGAQGARVRLGDVNAQTIARAEDMAREVTPDPYDVATQRMRAAAVMQGVAAQAGQPVGDVTQYQPPPTTPVTAPGNIPGPHQAQIAAPVGPATAPRRARPLASFDQEASDQFMGRPLRHIDMSPEPPPEYGVGPPSIRVTFEIRGFGVHQTNYHDIVVGEGFLVLVYDERFQGGIMYEPPLGDDIPAMAMEIVGVDEAHLVHTTGFSYSYLGRKFCILMIERSAPLNEGGGQPPPPQQ